MADEIEQGDVDESSSRGGKRKLIFIVLGVVLLAGGAGGAYFSGLIGPKKDAQQEEGHEEALPLPAKVTYYDLPDFLVNLSTATNQTSFVKMKITLELASETDAAIAREKLPVLQDHFNTYLRDLRASDLSGSAGMYRLREELLARANKSLAPVKVNNILFREILVQ